MATLYITEFANSGAAHGRSPSMGQWPAVAEQTLLIEGPHQESQPFNANTNMIRLNCDTTCSFRIDIPANAPVAQTTDARMVQNQTEYHSVSPGMVLSVIQNV